MLNVKISFGPHLGYRNQFVEIFDRSYELTLSLSDGTHTLASENFEIGVLHAFEGRRLFGHLTFRYSYDENQVITVCGTDFDSADGMCLSTAPERTSEYCHQRAAPGGYATDDLMANPHWNYCTPLTPGLEDVFKGMARSANEALISALEQVSGLTVQVRRRPPELSAENYLNLLTVYRDGEFLGPYDKAREYGPQDIVHSIESVFGGTVKFNLNEAFANVIGSTHDPKIAGLSWIALWANQFGVYPTICTSYHFNGFNCGNSLVGGHIVIGKVATKVPKGSNSVYIMPICKQHNNDDKVYMEALKYTSGIWLKNYMGT